MKKIYLVGLAFALFTSACDDVLEKTSSTQLPTEEAITSIEDLTNAVNGVYMDQATEVGSYAAEFGILRIYAGATSSRYPRTTTRV